ncbi:unnamed protein product [Rhizophagus irregularis]|nr:unnamed protein product [Rhizophagus irregularis]
MEYLWEVLPLVTEISDTLCPGKNLSKNTPQYTPQIAPANKKDDDDLTDFKEKVSVAVGANCKAISLVRRKTE